MDEEKERIEEINKLFDWEDKKVNLNRILYGANDIDDIKLEVKTKDQDEEKEDKMYPELKLTDAGDCPDEYHGYCPRCGEYLDDEDNFCSNCGQPLRWDSDEIKKKLGRSERAIAIEEKNNKDKCKYLDFANRINSLIIGIIYICDNFKDDIPNLEDFDNIDIQIKHDHCDGNIFTDYNIDIYSNDIYTSMSMDLDDGTGGIVIESKKINQDYKPVKAQKILRKKK